MWGTESAARKRPFTMDSKDVRWCFATVRRAIRTHRNLVEDIYRKIGMPIKYMSSGGARYAYGLRQPHFAHHVVRACADRAREGARRGTYLFDLAGGGFESTVRLAKSSPETWAPIFMQNKYNVLDVLREHIHQLQIFRRLLERTTPKD